jgi:hypothetical protein
MADGVSSRHWKWKKDKVTGELSKPSAMSKLEPNFAVEKDVPRAL